MTRTRPEGCKQGLLGAGLIALLTFLPLCATAQPTIAELSSRPLGERTSVEILATPHLAALEGFEAADARPLVNAIVAEEPGVIGIERLSALEIATMERTPSLAPVLEQFVGPRLLAAAEAAQDTLGISGSEAAAVTADWKAGATGLAPKRCAERLLTGLAAYQPETALLYRQCAPADAVTGDTAAYLDALAQSPNERVTIAAEAARALDLPKLWSIDSHLDKRLVLPRLEALTKAYAELGDITQFDYFQRLDALQAQGIAEGDLTAAYCFANSESFGTADVRRQFDLPNQADLPDNLGRIRQAAWDERNHRIAAHVRHMTAYAPGGAALVIIGAGHKPFLDELLATSLDSRTVNLPLSCPEGIEAG